MNLNIVDRSTANYEILNEEVFSHVNSTATTALHFDKKYLDPSLIDFCSLGSNVVLGWNSPTYLEQFVDALRQTKRSQLVEIKNTTSKIFSSAFRSITEADDPLEIRRRKVIGKLMSYSENLRQGWDGFDGAAPSTASSLDAIKIFEKLEKFKLQFHPQVSAEGEIGLYYEGSDLFIDFGFFGDGYYSVFAESSSEDEPNEVLLDCEPIDDEFNPSIEALLERAYSNS